MQDNIRNCFEKLRNLDTVEHSGKVMKVVGLTVESNGPAVNMGNICRIYPSTGDEFVEAEVVGFRDQRVLLMPFGDMTGIGFGSRDASGWKYCHCHHYRSSGWYSFPGQNKSKDQSLLQ
jgi:flagellum-specific ATP synthase